MEIISGEPRRRRSDDEKRAIVAETYAAGSVTAVARRLGINPSIVFAWRKPFRAEFGFSETSSTVHFAPVALIADNGAPASCEPPNPGGAIEIEIGANIRLRISGSVDPALAGAIAKALAQGTPKR